MLPLHDCRGSVRGFRLATLGLLVTSIALRSQDRPPLFRTTSELVTLDVQVVHVKSPAPAPVFGASDFQVSEEGVQQTILHFSRDEYPLSIVLLFDLTDSVRSMLKRLAEGAETALDHLKAADEVAVMVYSGHARLVSGFTTNRASTVTAIARAASMSSHEPAYFNEAVYQAAVQLGKTGKGGKRRVIIWLTDNLPNVPNRVQKYPPHTEAEASRALNENGVVVAPILLRSPAWEVLGAFVRAAEHSYEKSFPPGDACKYAELTGGEAVGLRGKHPGERLAQLIDDLRARYTISYRPSDPQPAGTFRNVRVTLAPSRTLRVKEWSVLARRGYYRQ